MVLPNPISSARITELFLFEGNAVEDFMEEWQDQETIFKIKLVGIIPCVEESSPLPSIGGEGLGASMGGGGGGSQLTLQVMWPGENYRASLLAPRLDQPVDTFQLIVPQHKLAMSS